MTEREPDDLGSQPAEAGADQPGPPTAAETDLAATTGAGPGTGPGTGPELVSGADAAVSEDELRALHEGRLSRSHARELRRRLGDDRHAQAALGAIIAASPDSPPTPSGATLEEPGAPPARGTAFGPETGKGSGQERSRLWAWAVVAVAAVAAVTAVVVVAATASPVAAPTSPPQRVAYLERAQLADRYPGIVGRSDAAYFTDLGLGPRQCLITASSMDADELLGTEPVIVEGRFGVLMAYSGTRVSSDAPRRRDAVTLEVFDRRCEVLAGVTVPR